MRQFLNLATEGHRDFPEHILSLEEEQDVLVEATQDQAVINSELQEVDRMGDMSDALEDMAVVADNIAGEATPTEDALVTIASNMAVAGTDVDASEIVPAMESHGGKRRYSAESIRERAKAIWEAIRKILKEIWKKIEAFFYKIFGTIPTLRKRIKELQKKVDDNSSKTIEHKKITISTGVSSLSANYKTPSTDAELRSNFTHLLGVAKDLYGDNVDQGIKMGETVLDALNDFDPEKAEDSLKTFLTKLSGQMKSVKGVKGGSKVNGNRFGEHVDAELSAPLLGNVSIVQKTPTYVKHTPGNAPILGMMENMRSYSMEVVQTAEKPKDVPASFEMSTASNASMSAMLDDAEEMLDVLEKFQRGKRATDMKSLRGKLETASDKATTAMNKAASKDEKEEQKAVPYYRALLNFNTAYARWMKDPALPMVSHSLSSIRGVVKVVEKSLAAYK